MPGTGCRPPQAAIGLTCWQRMSVVCTTDRAHQPRLAGRQRVARDARTKRTRAAEVRCTAAVPVEASATVDVGRGAGGRVRDAAARRMRERRRHGDAVRRRALRIRDRVNDCTQRRGALWAAGSRAPRTPVGCQSGSRGRTPPVDSEVTLRPVGIGQHHRVAGNRRRALPSAATRCGRAGSSSAPRRRRRRPLVVCPPATSAPAQLLGRRPPSTA